MKYRGNLRDMRLFLEDGTELPVEGVEEVGAGEPAGSAKPGDGPRRLGPWSGSATGQMNPREDAWLRYWTRVRPWLFCPLEYRLN